MFFLAGLIFICAVLAGSGQVKNADRIFDPTQPFTFVDSVSNQSSAHAHTSAFVPPPLESLEIESNHLVTPIDTNVGIVSVGGVFVAVVLVGLLYFGWRRSRLLLTKDSEDRYIKTVCPACDGSIEFPAQSVGEWIDCPHCAGSIELSAPRRLKRLLWNLRPSFNWKWACTLAACVIVGGVALLVYTDHKAQLKRQAEAQRARDALLAEQLEELREANRLTQERAEEEKRNAEAQKWDQAVKESKRLREQQLTELIRQQKVDEMAYQLRRADLNRHQEASELKQELERANRLAQEADWNRQQESLRLKQELARADWNRQLEALRQQQALDEANRLARQQQSRPTMPNNSYVRPPGVPPNAQLIRSGNGYVWVWQ